MVEPGNLSLGETGADGRGDAAPGIRRQAAALIARLGGGRLGRLRFRDAVNGFQNARDDLVRITLVVRAPIFEIASVAILDEVDWQANRSTTIRQAVAEFVDRLRFVQARQAQMIV